MDRFDHALNVLDDSLTAIAAKLDPPKVVPMGSGRVYRYKEKGIPQAIVQKLARTMTGLRAAVVLNQEGLTQEQGALHRMLDEFREDVTFLCLWFHDPDELHDKYLQAFYEEEFDNPEDAVASSQRRPMIRRKKIRAFISKDRGTGFDESTSVHVARTIGKTYSGFVHGASPQIMELYYGNPPRFHVQGAKDSPLFKDYERELPTYFYRALLSFSFAASVLGDQALFEQIWTYAQEFAASTDPQMLGDVIQK